jgi:hypothetical protein
MKFSSESLRRDRERKTHEKQFFILWFTIDVGLVCFREIKRVHATNLFVTEMERSFCLWVLHRRRQMKRSLACFRVF